MTVSVTPAGQVVRSVHWGGPVSFIVTDPRDVIQSVHLQGKFHEPEEGEVIRQWCPPGVIFCDIGANIGNHALFALKVLRVARLIAFEPNPAAISLLRENLELNGVSGRCDLQHLGLGLSDAPRAGFGIKARRRNLGSGHLVADSGDLAAGRGDAALGDAAVGFLKIDVEGMEVRVLAGLQGVIEAHRPVIFVEVDNDNRSECSGWLAESGHAVRARHRRYRQKENFLPVSGPLRRRAEA